MLKKGEVKMIKKMLKDGVSKNEIARRLGISRETVIVYTIRILFLSAYIFLQPFKS